MKLTFKHVQLVLLAFAFTFITWSVVSIFIVDVTFFKWIIIEIIFGIMLKLHKFTASLL